MKYLAIIPARGGSKGILKKNIRLLDGKPLIAYTLEAAISSKYIDKIIISTDDPEIVKVGERYGLNSPFLRPKKYAQDSSRSIDVVLHTISWLAKHMAYKPDAVILLQPTSPLRTVDHINNAIRLFNKKKPDTLVSVVEVPHNYAPAKLLEIKNDLLKNLHNQKTEDILKPRQSLPKVYARNGPAILIVNSSYLKKSKAFYDGDTIPFLMSSDVSIDIDNKFDLLLSELIIKHNKVNEKNI